jgi:hypothetical protein
MVIRIIRIAVGLATKRLPADGGLGCVPNLGGGALYQRVLAAD